MPMQPSHWAKPLHLNREVKQKVNKPSFSPFSVSYIFISQFAEILPGGTISLLGSTEVNLSRRLTRRIRNIFRRKRRRGSDGADSKSVEASQSL